MRSRVTTRFAARQAADARRAEQLAVGQQQQPARRVRRARADSDPCTRPMPPGGGSSRSSATGAVGRPASSSSSPTRLAWSVVTTTRRPAAASSSSQAPARSARPGQRRGGARSRHPRRLPRRAAPRRARSAAPACRSRRTAPARRPGSRPTPRGRRAGRPPAGRGRRAIATSSSGSVRTTCAVAGDVVRRRAGGEERGPRLGRLAEVALRRAAPRPRCSCSELRAGAYSARRRPALGRQELGCRQEVDLGQAPARRLRHRIEAADRLDLVAEQLDPHRLRGSRRPRVDQAAAVRELGDAGDLARPGRSRRPPAR